MIINKKNYNYLFCLLLLVLPIELIHVKESYANSDAILVVDRSIDNAITKLSANAREVLFSIKGKAPASDIEIDPRDGTIWVTYKTSSTLVKYSADGKDKLLEIKNSFCTPRHSALDIKDNVVWIASWTQGELIKYSMLDGSQLLRIQDLGNVYEVLISPFDDTIWIGDQKINKFIHFSSDGKMLGFTERRLGVPLNLAIDKRDGSLWATFHDVRGRVAKFSNDGKFILVIEDFNSLENLTIDPQDGSVWVTDAQAGELIHISSGGEILRKIGGFRGPSGLSEVDPKKKIFWMANTGDGEIIRFSLAGEVLDRVKVSGSPVAVITYAKN